MNPHILIVEDEPRIASLLADYLHREGMRTTLVEQGDAVIELVRNQNPDLVLLDLMLPGRDGISLCREVRTFSDLPIIMVTARVEEIDRLLGLELGADDYICKPFSPREVVARVKAVLRRGVPAREELQPSPLMLDEQKCRALLHGDDLLLTVVEFQLLAILASQPGRIFSRNQLMDRMYQDHRTVSDRTIDSHIKKLRRKISDIHPDCDLIRSVYGAGYAFTEDLSACRK